MATEESLKEIIANCGLEGVEDLVFELWPIRLVHTSLRYFEAFCFGIAHAVGVRPKVWDETIGRWLWYPVDYEGNLHAHFKGGAWTVTKLYAYMKEFREDEDIIKAFTEHPRYGNIKMDHFREDDVKHLFSCFFRGATS